MSRVFQSRIFIGPSGTIKGTVNGTLALSQVAFGTALNTIGSSANFTYTPATLTLTLTNPTLATAILNQNSPTITLVGNFWNGAASATDTWTIEDVIGAGPTSVLTFLQSGVPANMVAVSIPQSLIITPNIALGVSSEISLSGGVSGTAILTVQSIAGAPNPLALPTTNPTNVQALIGTAGVPTSLTWGQAGIVLGSVNSLANTGNLAATQLIAAAQPTGMYLVTLYVEVTTGVATSTIIPNIAYADDTGAQNQYGPLINAAVTGTVASLTFPIWFVTGTALTFSMATANNPKYNVYARAQAL